MRILFLALDVDLAKQRGDTVHATELATALAGLGHDVALAVGAGGTPTTGLHQSVEVRTIHGPDHEVLSAVQALANDFRPDVLYERRTSPKVGFAVHIRRRIPFVMEVNGILSDELAYQGRETRRSALRTAKSVVRGVMFRGVDRFVVVGHAIGKDLVCRYRVDPSRICVIGNGVNVDRFQPMEKNRASELVGLDPNLPRAIFVGNLVGWRDFDALFEAMRVARSRIASLQLAVVGDGPERARLEEVARRTLPPGSVLFTGEVPHYDVPAYICSGEVAILPAKPWSVDISPLKLFEYLACGRPVVAFDVAGLDFITSRGVGRLVSPGDGIGLGMAIADLIENAPARAEMGRRARECALTERSWVAIAGRVAEVLEEALRSRR